MKKYTAIDPKYKQGVFLTSDEQMDKYLNLGCEIHEIEDGIEKTIATPEEGFLVERPEFPIITNNIGR